MHSDTNKTMPEGSTPRFLSIEGIGKVEATGTRESLGAIRVELEPAEPGVIAQSLTTNQLEEKVKEGEVEEATPDPRTLHQRRSERSQELDEEFNAPITTDIEKWANDKDHWDFPGVDTGPTFRKENPDFDAGEFLDDMFSLE